MISLFGDEIPDLEGAQARDEGWRPLHRAGQRSGGPDLRHLPARQRIDLSSKNRTRDAMVAECPICKNRCYLGRIATKSS